MRFLVDMPLSPSLARWLSGQGHDAVHAGEIGLALSPDILILQRARDEQRTIITADLDFPRLLALSAASEPSLILFRGGNWSDGDVVKRIGQLLAAYSADDLISCIIVVDRNRIRRRKLPA